MGIVALVIAGYAAGVAWWVLAERGARYRVDLSPGESAFRGRSRIYQVNVLRRANYRPEGHRLHRWLVVLYLVTGVAFFGAGLLFAGAYIWHS